MRNQTIRTVLISVLLLAFSLASAFAQGGAVNQVEGPPPNNTVSTFYYSGTSLIYVCVANSLQPTTTFYKSSTTLTNIVVTTNSAVATFSSTSYLWVGAMVTVAGSTTSALNGTYLITAVSGSTATFTTSGVGDATYNNAALTLSTSHPLLNATVWAIKSLKYDGSSNLITVKWGGSAATNVPGLACSARASY